MHTTDPPPGIADFDNIGASRAVSSSGASALIL
jgi:hypothetical protein